jgi:hypothetical protein
MRCAKIFNDLRSLSLHHPPNPSVVMLWCLREAQSYPLVFRAFSQVSRAQEIGAVVDHQKTARNDHRARFWIHFLEFEAEVIKRIC